MKADCSVCTVAQSTNSYIVTHKYSRKLWDFSVPAIT